MHNVITGPLWLAGDHAEFIVRVLLAPLSDPRGWSGSMDSPGCRLTLLALLGVLAAVWLCGRGGPPRGGGQKAGGAIDANRESPARTAREFF